MIFRSFLSARLLLLPLATAPLACGIRTPLELDEIGQTARDAGPGKPGSGGVVDAAAPPVDAQVVVDAGAPIDDGGGIDVALPAFDVGDILLTSGSYGGGTGPTLNVAGVFYRSVASTGCSVALVGGCKLETCTPPGGGSPLASAGTIDITGGAYPVVVPLGSGGLYTTPPPDPDSGVRTLWYGGETLHVSASGADVPPFATDVVAPSQITVATGMPAAVARTEPFEVHWYRQSAGQVAVDLTSAAGPTSYYLECLFDVTAGVGVVPQAALAAIAGGTGTLRVFTVTKDTVDVAGWTVGTFAQTNANDPGGREWTGQIVIQ